MVSRIVSISALVSNFNQINLKSYSTFMCIWKLRNWIWVRMSGRTRAWQNGISGEIRDIIYFNCIGSMPDIPIVYIPDYVGPQFFLDHERKNWIPFETSSNFCEWSKTTRTNYPFQLAYEMTIHMLFEISRTDDIKLCYQYWRQWADSGDNLCRLFTVSRVKHCSCELMY